VIFGLLDQDVPGGRADVAAKCRDLTVSWSRYGYRGPFLVASEVEAILDEAARGGHDYCLIQAPGHIVSETWRPLEAEDADFPAALRRWLATRNFLVAGWITHSGSGWYGLDPRCLVVDLREFAKLGRPRFGEAHPGRTGLPSARPRYDGGVIVALEPAGGEESCNPAHAGWNLLAAGLRRGLTALGIGRELSGATLNVAPLGEADAAAFARFLGRGIRDFPAAPEAAGLNADQRAFLGSIAPQASGATRGVFLWNIESYDDVETPPEAFAGPVTTLYSVAAGFKPNRILQTHGFDRLSRVVFFDYSASALRVRKYLVKEWNGSDFPRLARDLFDRFPEPDTFYQLWGGRRPHEIDDVDLEGLWRRELDRWGGDRAFRDHWQSYQTLTHEYVHCDIMADPGPLIERIAPEPGAVIWWSNAFFTMFGNWFYGPEERRRSYQAWVDRLTAANPSIFLYGSDNDNTPVNFVRSADYRDARSRAGGNWRRPPVIHRREIRM